MARRSTIHAVTTIGIDMGKNTLHMVGLDSRGAIVLREKVSRGRIASRLANLPPCLIGIEAGMATHYVARELAALGHDVTDLTCLSRNFFDSLMQPNSIGFILEHKCRCRLPQREIRFATINHTIHKHCLDWQIAIRQSIFAKRLPIRRRDRQKCAALFDHAGFTATAKVYRSSRAFFN
jgi:hypothetical protein